MPRLAKHPAILPIFLPQRGCLRRCSFCDQQSQTGAAPPQPPHVAEPVLRRRLEAIRHGGRKAALAFYGGSFDGLPGAEREAWLELAGALQRDGLVEGGVRVSAHPAGLSIHRIDALRRGGVGVVEVGVQSLDDAVLRRAARGHDAGGAEAACRRVMGAGLRCVVQLMAGLPGADRAGDLRTAGGIAALRPQGVRIHPTLVLQGTGLEDELSRGWRPPDLEEAVERVAAMVAILEAAEVPVIRLGVQDTGCLGARVLAGAWHPAFGELVYGELLARRLAQGLGPGDRGVEVPRREASRLLGHGRRGLRRLEELAGRTIEVVLV